MNLKQLQKKQNRLFSEFLGFHAQLAGFDRRLWVGSLFERFTTCKKPNCKCARGEKHGPFLYASNVIQGKTIQRYVGKDEDAHIVAKLRNYREFRATLSKLRELAKKMDDTWRAIEETLTDGRIQ